MRVALAQINPTVGDVAGNARLVREAVGSAKEAGADVVLCPEMVLLGYPPRDLILRDSAVERCEEAVAELAPLSQNLTIIVGHPRRVTGGRRDCANSASVLQRGRVVHVYDKQLLPGYDVFDEDRYFEPGRTTCVANIAGTRAGILICEDIWQARDVEGGQHLIPVNLQDPVVATIQAGAQALLILSASPFVIGKGARHVDHLRLLARSHRVPVALVNQVGANDDLVFDGRSIAISAEGEPIAVSCSFESDLVVADLAATKSIAWTADNPIDEIWRALVLGVRDYFRKVGAKDALIGLSGGIDSALVATIAAAALGPQNVIGVMMPSRHSSRGSTEDSVALARRLDLGNLLEIPIERAHAALSDTIVPALADRAGGVTDENIQSRARGIILMALSNATGGLVLATGNKSELAAGYTTLYGDMCGALAVLGDVYKTQVWELSRWVNANHAACGFARPPIPQSSIDKPPSAELRPNQTDQDTLPPYAVLDEIIRRWIDHEEDVESIVRGTGFDRELVGRWTGIIDRTEYKRRQAAIILKMTPRAFGPGRPMPVAMRWS